MRQTQEILSWRRREDCPRRHSWYLRQSPVELVVVVVGGGGEVVVVVLGSNEVVVVL